MVHVAEILAVSVSVGENRSLDWGNCVKSDPVHRNYSMRHDCYSLHFRIRPAISVLFHLKMQLEQMCLVSCSSVNVTASSVVAQHHLPVAAPRVLVPSVYSNLDLHS